jgi:hypothetical protein
MSSNSDGVGGAGGFGSGGNAYTFDQALTRLSANDPDVELTSSYLAGTLEPEAQRTFEARLRGGDGALREIMDAFTAFWNEPALEGDGVRDVTPEEAAAFKQRLARMRGPFRLWYEFVNWWSGRA